MTKNRGILENKLKRYYRDTNSGSYIEILCEAIMAFRGEKFDKILDIGCGVGTFSKSIKPYNYDVYGVEASKFGIAESRKAGVKVSELELAVNAKLPFPNDTFSFVLMNQVIEHLPKEAGQYYVEEIMRVLKPGGVAIVNSPSRYSRIWLTDPHHIYCWRPNELRDEFFKYKDQIASLKLKRIPLEFWMFFKYNENIINYWHKYNKSPFIKRTGYLFAKALDLVISKISGSDRLLAAAGVVVVKS